MKNKTFKNDSKNVKNLEKFNEDKFKNLAPLIDQSGKVNASKEIVKLQILANPHVPDKHTCDFLGNNKPEGPAWSTLKNSFIDPLTSRVSLCLCSRYKVMSELRGTPTYAFLRKFHDHWMVVHVYAEGPQRGILASCFPATGKQVKGIRDAYWASKKR